MALRVEFWMAEKTRAASVSRPSSHGRETDRGITYCASTERATPRAVSRSGNRKRFSEL